MQKRRKRLEILLNESSEKSDTGLKEVWYLRLIEFRMGKNKKSSKSLVKSL